MRQGDGIKRPPHFDGGGQESHGPAAPHVCHACRWPFPNPHPSAKQRRAHRKHCGKIEGFPAPVESEGVGTVNGSLCAAELSDESNGMCSAGGLVRELALEPGEAKNAGCDCRIQDVKGVEPTGGEEIMALEPGKASTAGRDCGIQEVKGVEPTSGEEKIPILGCLSTSDNDSTSDQTLKEIAPPLRNEIGIAEKATSLANLQGRSQSNGVLPINSANEAFDITAKSNLLNAEGNECSEKQSPLILIDSSPNNNPASKADNIVVPCPMDINFCKKGQKSKTDQDTTCSNVIYDFPNDSCINTLKLDSNSPQSKEGETILGEKEHGEELSNCLETVDMFSIPILVDYPKNVVDSKTKQRTDEESGNEAFDWLRCAKADANSVGIPVLIQVDSPYDMADNIMIGKTYEEEIDYRHAEPKYELPESSCSVEIPMVASAISVQYNASAILTLGKMGEVGIESGHQELEYKLGRRSCSAEISIAAGASTIPLQDECSSDLLKCSVEGQTDEGQTESRQQESRNKPFDSSFIKEFDFVDHVVASTVPTQIVDPSDITVGDMKKWTFGEEIESGQQEPICEPTAGLCTVDTNFADSLHTSSDPAQLNSPSGLDASSINAKSVEDMPILLMYKDIENSEERDVHNQFHEPVNALVIASSKISGMQEDPSKVAKLDELHPAIMHNEPGKNVGNVSFLEEGKSCEAIDTNCIHDEADSCNEARHPFVNHVTYTSEIVGSTEKVDKSAEAPERDEFKPSPSILKEEALEDQKSTSDGLVVSSAKLEAKLLDGFDDVGQHDLAACSKSPRQRKSISNGPDSVIVSVQQEENKEEFIFREDVLDCDFSHEMGRDSFTQITFLKGTVFLDAENGSCCATPEELDMLCLAGESNQYVSENASCTERDDHANAEGPQCAKGLVNNEPERSLELIDSDAASVVRIFNDNATKTDSNLDCIHNDMIDECCKQPESDTNPQCTAYLIPLLDVEENELKKGSQLTENSLNGTSGAAIILENTCSTQSNLFKYTEKSFLEESAELPSVDDTQHSHTKAGVLIENADLETRVYAHPSARLVPKQNHLVGAVCLESKPPALDEFAGSSMSTQPLLLNSDALKEPKKANTSFPSGGVDNHLGLENNANFQKPEDETTLVSLEALIDFVNQTGCNGPISVSSAGNQSDMVFTEADHTKRIQPPVPDGDYVTGFVPAISSETCINGAHLSELPLKNVIELGSQSTCAEIQPFKSTGQSTRSLKNSGEITENAANWSSVKIHTPLKSLLVEANIESKQKVSPFNNNSPMKEHISMKEHNDVPDKGHSPSTLVSSTVAEHCKKPEMKRLVQKEWNSPARLPPATKNAKGKSRGKPQWVPFMCCPSVNQ